MSVTTPEDEKFLAALSDVVWRFHVYDQYAQKPKKAIKALSKRAPGHSAEFYREQFELNLRLLIATIEAVEEAPKHFKSENKYSEYSDVDSEAAIHKLQVTFPEQSNDFLKTYLGMVIYWFYLR